MIGRIGVGIGLIEIGIGLTELGIGLIELGIGLIELRIGLRINNARRTVLARVSGLVHFAIPILYILFIYRSVCWSIGPFVMIESQSVKTFI